MAGFPTTVTNAGRAKIISNGLLANARKIAFGTGHDPTPADATGLVTPYSPEKVFDIIAGHQNGAQIQVVFQEGETLPGADYSPTEMAILDDADAVISYGSVSTGSLFTKGTAPHQWTYIGELLNLPDGATINFTTTVGYFVATTEVRGVGELAEDAEVATPPTDYPRLLTTDNIDAIADEVIDEKVKAYQYSEIVIKADSGSGGKARIGGVNNVGGVVNVDLLAAGTGYPTTANAVTATVEKSIGTGCVLSVSVNTDGTLASITPTTAGTGYGESLPSAVPADGTIELLYEAWGGEALGG